MLRSISFVLAVATLSSACSSVPSVAQLPAGNPDSSVDYRIARGDRIRIRIWPDSALGGEFPVEQDGLIHLPALGGLPVAGVQLSELRRDLRTRYEEVMRNPTVSVTPLFRVSVLGAVQRPGLYEVDPTQGIVDAISLAGGFRPNARENRIRIVRDGEVLRLEDEDELGQAGGDPRWQLRSGDRIVVPEGFDFSIRDALYVLQGAVLVVTLYRQTQD